MEEGQAEVQTAIQGEGWKEAAKLLEPLRSAPSNFVVTVRTLWLQHQRGETSLSSGAVFELGRLLNAHTVKAAYYYFSKAYRPEILTAKPVLDADDFLNGYTAFEHAALISLVITFRNLLKRSDREEWSYIQGPLYESLEVGAQVGSTIPKIGLGFGLLSRGFRYLAFAPFLWNSKNAFKEYRRYLKSKDLPFDHSWEQKTWGCTNAQIAALLLQRVGFSTKITHGFFLAVSDRLYSPLDPVFGEPFQMAETWVDSIMEHGKAPSIPQKPDYCLPADEADALIGKVKNSLDAGEVVEWLNKGKANINKQSTPEFFDAVPTPEPEPEPGPEIL